MKQLQWLHPQACTPPHAVGRPEQVEELAHQFQTSGWDRSKPALIGYPWEGSVQLLSGSHRWAASVQAQLEAIPVVVVDFALVDRAWGTDEWAELMRSGNNVLEGR